MSTWENSPRVFVTRESTPEEFNRSASITRLRLPSFTTASAEALSFSLFLPARTRSAPKVASPREIIEPRLPLAPLTSATFPLRLKRSFRSELLEISLRTPLLSRKVAANKDHFSPKGPDGKETDEGFKKPRVSSFEVSQARFIEGVFTPRQAQGRTR